MPNYRRHYLAGHPVFVTIVTHGRRPWLGEEPCAELVLAAMRSVRERHRFKHLAHVLMPDHLHWILTPSGPTFSATVAAFKREVTWRFKAAAVIGPPPYWQDRFYDHVIRDESDLQRHLDYVHFNPAKHGLGQPAEYPFSSLREWMRRGRYEADWGRAAPDSIRDMALE